MAKTLELKFLNEEGKVVTISLDDPVEPVDELAVSAAMDTIVTENAFISSGGEFVSKKEARIVERNVTEIPVA
jgi:aromatic ring-opening dioxygenase catalytic subunit (LigB family)